MDGVTSTEDKIIIMTTNFREKLSIRISYTVTYYCSFSVKDMEALMRPGRIDKIIHITYADTEALYELFLHFYPGIYFSISPLLLS